MALIETVIHSGPGISVSLVLDDTDTIVVGGAVRQRVVTMRTNRTRDVPVRVFVNTWGADRVRRSHVQDVRSGSARGIVTATMPPGVYTNGLEVVVSR